MNLAPHRLILALGLAATVGASTSAHAAVNLNGTKAGLQWGTAGSVGAALSVDVSGVSGGGSFVDSFAPSLIGAGVSPTFADPALGVDVNVSGSVVTITENPADYSTSFTSAAVLGVAFNGLVLQDQSIALTGASLAGSTVPGFAAGDVQTANGGLWINLAGLIVGQSQQITIDLTQGGPIGTTSGVPEPASWALMIVGFGAVGAVIRRRPPVESQDA